MLDENTFDEMKTKDGRALEKFFRENEEISVDIKQKFESLRKFSEDFSALAYPVSKAIDIYLDQVQKFIESSSLQFNKPDSFISEIKKACKKNAASGWCMSACFSIATYREIADSRINNNETDRLFVNEFESKGFELYNAERDFIVNTAQQGWRTFYEECFYLIDNQKYQAAVPSLMSAVEQELSFEGTNDVGKPLINLFKSSVERDEDPTSFLYAMSTSVISLLKNRIFKYGDFNSRRPSIINRNWVMHGRDTPSLWGKQDVYKLIALISALRMLNRRSLSEQ